tara:strand:+ start:415 stop:795 length:381 start_codon:yes stop_codon:yes gene_type:complete
MTLSRFLWVAAGGLSLAVGIIGIAVPLLPTTPFVLLAAFAFARSSPRLHRWLVSHRRFGPMITDWQRHGAISRPAKQMAMASLVVVFLISVAFNAPIHVLAIQAVILTGVGIFILSRPGPPSDCDE